VGVGSPGGADPGSSCKGGRSAARLLDSLRAMGDSGGAAAWASSFRQSPGLTAPVWDNNWIREEVALALGEPVPAGISAPRWEGAAPDVIRGISAKPAFCEIRRARALK
jgi:hypothetical protein